MKLAIILNPKARNIQLEYIQKRIQKVLFRCYLDFFSEDQLDNLGSFIEDQLKRGINYFIVVGGDGSLNRVVNHLIGFQKKNYIIPPICIIQSGTANDLAHELGIELQLEKAIQTIFAGNVREIDLLKVTANGHSSYMITNGGVGLAAKTAREANELRSKLYSSMTSKSPLQRQLSQFKSLATRALGEKLYTLLLIKNWMTWSREWIVELKGDKDFSITTQSPFVFINNQTRLAGRYLTAPTTRNNDGKFNFLILNHKSVLEQIVDVANIGRGRWRESKNLISREVSSLSIASRGNSLPLTFFGDGEILHDNVPEIKVQCLPRKLKVLWNYGGVP